MEYKYNQLDLADREYAWKTVTQILMSFPIEFVLLMLHTWIFGKFWVWFVEPAFTIIKPEFFLLMGIILMIRFLKIPNAFAFRSTEKHYSELTTREKNVRMIRSIKLGRDRWVFNLLSSAIFFGFGAFIHFLTSL